MSAALLDERLQHIVTKKERIGYKVLSANIVLLSSHSDSNNSVILRKFRSQNDLVTSANR